MHSQFEIFLELNKFNGIVFNDADHSYTYNGKPCVSVTSIISKFKKPFETEKRATGYAKKHGLEVEDVIANWDLSGKKATHKGSEAHKYAEYKFFNKHYDVDIFSGALPICRKIDKFFNGLSHLSECEFNTYSLQTTIYRKIIERNTSLLLGDSYVCWVNDENESYEIIKMDYMEREFDIIYNTIAA